MSVSTLPASDLRKGLHTILESLTQPLFITQRGRVRAVLLDIDRYNQIMDELEDLHDTCDPGVLRALSEAKAAQDEDLVPLNDVRKKYGL